MLMDVSLDISTIDLKGKTKSQGQKKVLAKTKSTPTRGTRHVHGRGITISGILKAIRTFLASRGDLMPYPRPSSVMCRMCQPVLPEVIKISNPYWCKC